MIKPKNVKAAAPRNLTLVLLLSIAGFLAGCGGTETHHLMNSDRATLSENRARWETAERENFSYTLTRSCFCVPEGPWRIFYADGLFQQLLDLDGDLSEVSLSEIPKTVEELFDLLEQAYEDETAEVTVQYHPKFAVPTLIDIDWVPDAEDDGVSYYLIDFAMPGSETDDFYRARLAWSNLASSSYSYRLNISCYCAITGPVDVVVEGGVVTSAVLEGGDALTQSEINQLPLTIDQLFDVIANHREDEDNQIEVTFADSGYPTSIAINEDQLAVDGGVIYSVSMYSLR